MSVENNFPDELLLNEPDRRARLIREFYEQYGESRPTGYYDWGRQHEEAKSAFYRKNLETLGHDTRSLGVDIGCQGGVLINFVNLIRWVGVDIDELALAAAREAGVACHEMDFTSAIDFRDESFDVDDDGGARTFALSVDHGGGGAPDFEKETGERTSAPRRWIITCTGGGKSCAASGSPANRPMCTTFPSRNSIGSCDFISRRSNTCR